MLVFIIILLALAAAGVIVPALTGGFDFRIGPGFSLPEKLCGP